MISTSAQPLLRTTNLTELTHYLSDVWSYHPTIVGILLFQLFQEEINQQDQKVMGMQTTCFKFLAEANVS